MAHFARIEDGIVREVVVVDNEQLLDENGQEVEALGLAYLAQIGLTGTWVQTSYNGSFRGRYAGTGMFWDGTEFLAAPVELATDRDSIPPDGVTPAVVTYRNADHAAAPAEVMFTVNGAATTVPVAAGRASLEVVSTTPGDTIVVTVDALPDASVTITVEAAA